MRKLLVAVVAMLMLSHGAADASNAQFQRHPLLSVPLGDRVVVNYAGMPVTVRLAHLNFDGGNLSGAKTLIENLSKRKLVRVAFSTEAGLDENGFPNVFMTIGGKLANAEIVKAGFAAYDNGGKPSKYYHVKLAAAVKAAAKAGHAVSVSAKPPRKPSAAKSNASTASPGVSGGSYYAELQSSNYHTAHCRWARQMSSQRRIRYKSVDAAERAGKMPCWICMEKRAKAAMMGNKSRDGGVKVVAGAGPLVGLVKTFHAPNCERILKKKASDLKSFDTVAAAKRAGLAACTRCLRLDNKLIPAPGPDECIGRAPPGRRPCRRAPANKSGLCSHCLGKGE